MASICETVTGASMEAIVAARDAAGDADLVEIRLDYVQRPDVRQALHGRKRPVVMTCRAAWEGGKFLGGEEERLRLLEQAAEAGADFVDLEWRAARPDWARKLAGTRLVLSHHDFSGVPADLGDRLRAMRAEQPFVVKVAVAARSLTDCLALRREVEGGGRQVAIAMGSAGHVTRVWPAGWGSCWTYAGSGAAPGQLSARELAFRYRVRSTTTSTRLFAVAGQPLGHSASPPMHNAAFAAEDIDAVYVPLESSSADELRTVAESLRVQGISVTAPLKTACAARCQVVDDETKRTGAVNTIRPGARGWEGRNFDVAGFVTPLDRRGLARAGERALVLGAGGAARSVVEALVARGVRVSIAARRPEAAADLARAREVSVAPWPPPRGWDLLVNATPAGAWPRESEMPVDPAEVDARVVYDLVYNPPVTRLLEAAAKGGARTIGGLEMLVEQACRQFEWWTSRPAPRAVMEEAARAFLAEVS